jgi:hypothetical protein
LASREIGLRDDVKAFDIGEIERQLCLEVPERVEDRADLTYKES